MDKKKKPTALNDHVVASQPLFRHYHFASCWRILWNYEIHFVCILFHSKNRLQKNALFLNNAWKYYVIFLFVCFRRMVYGGGSK